eukprot:1011558-Pelagomonas_calceolata.AAC.1
MSSARMWVRMRIGFRQQINVVKYRTGTVYTQKHAIISNRSSTNGRCPLCDDMDSINYNVLRCPNPTMSGMLTNRHHVGLSFCVKALSKG